MKIIAFGASTSSTSINKALATFTANLVDGAQVQVLNINDYSVPMFSEDLEKEIGQAEGAQAFLRDLAQADAFVISFAEHNGHYPAAYKNLFDWQLVSIALCLVISQRCTCLRLQALVVQRPCLLPLPLQRLSLG